MWLAMAYNQWWFTPALDAKEPEIVKVCSWKLGRNPGFLYVITEKQRLHLNTSSTQESNHYFDVT
jgi:hypothetical protein